MTKLKSYQKLFEDYEVDPSPAVWERISMQLDNKKQRKAWLIPILSLLIAGTLGGSMTLYYYTSPKITSNTTAPELQITNNFSSTNNTHNIPDKITSDQHTNPTNAKLESNKPISTRITNTNSSIIENRIILVDNPKNSGEPIANTQTNKLSEQNFITTVADKYQFSKSSSSLAAEKINLLALKQIYLDDKTSDFILSERSKPEKLGKSPVITRWELSTFFGISNSFRSISTSGQNRNNPENISIPESEKSINAYNYGMELSYNISPKIQLFTGVGRNLIGQEKIRSFIYLKEKNIFNSSENVYAISTSSGELKVNADEFDYAYFQHQDSSLISYRPASSIVLDTSTTRDFNLVHSIEILTIPVGLTLEPLKSRISPVIGIYFAANYSMNEKLYIKGTEVAHTDAGLIKKWSLSAGARLGIKYQISSRLAFGLFGQYWKGIGNWSKEQENTWVPYAGSLGCGLHYRLAK